MKKIKSKRRKISVTSILIVFIIGLCLLSVGYSRFSSNLIVKGNVSVIPQTEQKIKIKPGSDGKYGTLNLNSTYFTVGNEIIDENGNVTLNITQNSSNNGTRLTVNFSFSFENTSAMNVTDVSVEANNQDTSGAIRKMSESVSSVTLAPGESASVSASIQFTPRKQNMGKEKRISYIVSYSINGEEKQIIYTIIVK